MSVPVQKSGSGKVRMHASTVFSALHFLAGLYSSVPTNLISKQMKSLWYHAHVHQYSILAFFLFGAADLYRDSFSFGRVTLAHMNQQGHQTFPKIDTVIFAWVSEVTVTYYYYYYQ